jgi:hypothetical protein
MAQGAITLGVRLAANSRVAPNSRDPDHTNIFRETTKGSL